MIAVESQSQSGAKEIVFAVELKAAGCLLESVC
jgi:hypothetical protein